MIGNTVKGGAFSNPEQDLGDAVVKENTVKINVELNKVNTKEGTRCVLKVSDRDGFSSLCSWGNDASRQDIADALRRLAAALEW